MIENNKINPHGEGEIISIVTSTCPQGYSMSRYKEPSAPKAPYITPLGHTALVKELQTLWKVKRPEVTERVAEAAAMGDRSENAEYIYGKKQLREMDRRIRYLANRLDELIVVDRLPKNQEKVFFGAWVRITSSSAEEHLRIVGPDELDLKENYISIDSPMARALIGKSLGDTVQVKGKSWYLKEIYYEDYESFK